MLLIVQSYVQMLLRDTAHQNSNNNINLCIFCLTVATRWRLVFKVASLFLSSPMWRNFGPKSGGPKYRFVPNVSAALYIIVWDMTSVRRCLIRKKLWRCELAAATGARARPPAYQAGDSIEAAASTAFRRLSGVAKQNGWEGHDYSNTAVPPARIPPQWQSFSQNFHRVDAVQINPGPRYAAQNHAHLRLLVEIFATGRAHDVGTKLTFESTVE